MKASRPLRLTLSALSLALAAGVSAQTGISDDVVKIGVLTDLSGIYSDFAGQGSIEAVKLAVEDMGGTVAGKKIEVVSADHQNKADVGAAKAREWFDAQKVDMITDLVGSAP